MEENPLYYLFSRLWYFARERRRKIVLVWTLFVVGQALALLLKPLLWAWMMNTIQRDGLTSESIPTIVWILVLQILVTIAFWAFHGPGRWIEQATAFWARLGYREFLLKGIMTLPMEWHTEHHSGDVIDKVSRGTSAIYNFSEDTFEIIYSFVRLVGSYAILVYFSPPAAIIVFVMMAVSAWITIRFDRVLIGKYKQINRAENKISESIIDAISNITTVIVLRVEKLVYGAIMKKIRAPYELEMRTNLLGETKWFLTNICTVLMTAVVLTVYFWQNMAPAGTVMIGSVYLLVNYLSQIGELFFQFTSKYSTIVRQKARVMNAEELSVSFRDESFANHVLPPDWKNVRIEGLTFSYASEEEGDPHLEDISLSLARGQRIALIGESGSGKTTLLKIMRDLYHPERLTLSVDGRAVPHGFAGISRAISLVPQNPEIFATTILENITIGAEHDMPTVRRFTDMACFTETVLALPRGFDSSIREKGVNLSGGQQQRLALSRGLLACRDKDFVLLDEPTSSLDTPTEWQVYQNIMAAFDDKTIVASVHRLHLLPLFDRIYLFENGQIAADGSLKELLEDCEQFRELWRQYQQSDQI